MSVTWLHISDFHVRGGDPYDRDVVLQALVKSVGEYRERGRAPDLVFATGDIAHAGKPEEYEFAEKFFNDLLRAVSLDKRRLFVIPGNHDVNRDFGLGLLRTLETREEADTYFRPDLPKPHLSLKLRAYFDWHKRYFAGVRGAPEDSTCGPAELVEVHGHRLGILPINSALFCQNDEDHGKLWIGRRCLGAALEDLQKAGGELKIALVHHPLEWLCPTEGSNIEAELAASVDILLRGHLHETRVESVISNECELFRCAAGAAYQTRKWPNRALYATYDGGSVSVFPIRFEDAPRPIWTTDPSVFPREPGHEKTFPLRRVQQQEVRSRRRAAEPRDAVVARFRSNIGSRGNRPFVGREDLISRIAESLADPAQENVMVLHGKPGVGKSELAREFARLHRDRYSGGTFWVDASTDSVAISLASIGKNILDLDFPSDLPLNDQGLQTFYALGALPVLLIYDNVVSFERIQQWLPLSGMPCHVLITTLLDREDSAWPWVEVNPLSRERSLELIEKLTDNDFVTRYGAAIAEHAGGLPVQIVPETTTLALERRRGHGPSSGSALTREAGDSFRAAYRRLEQPARLLLHTAAGFNPQRIPSAELSRCLQQGIGWSESEFERAVDACFDLHLLDGSPDPMLHRLFAAFLRETLPSADDQVQLVKVRAAQRMRFMDLVERLRANVADAGGASKLISYPLTPAEWTRLGQSFSMDEGRRAGGALYEIGQFKEALPWFERIAAEAEKGDEQGRIDHPTLGSSLHRAGDCLASMGQYGQARLWFERALAEAEKGDAQGRIDHESVGSSLHQVGDCLANTGRYAEAWPWIERAVAEKEKGDVHGRIDHESLGNSLHQVGYCLSRTGQYAEARGWFERAVAEAEKGDVHGLVDHASLGSSLHQVGYCLASAGQYAEAQPWFERAVAEAGKGDVHGRVDHGSLGRSLHLVGHCLASTRRFAEARPWFERAVAEKEKGDIHGRIDHDSLGRSLHQVGYCLWSTGQDAEARPWFERAGAEKQKGDVHGRVDHESLGSSLHQVGFCLSSTGQYAEARPWFERAVAEAEKGDVHGRIDHESLGSSLHQVGFCLSSMGQYAGAGPWFERAVAEAGRGDVHGRVDHDSLGRSLHLMGECLASMGKFAEARPWLERAVAEKEKGNVHGRVDAAGLMSTLRAAGACLRKLGESEKAREMEQRAASLS